MRAPTSFYGETSNTQRCGLGLETATLKTGMERRKFLVRLLSANCSTDADRLQAVTDGWTLPRWVLRPVYSTATAPTQFVIHSTTIMHPKSPLSGTLGSVIFVRTHPPQTPLSEILPLPGKQCVSFCNPSCSLADVSSALGRKHDRHSRRLQALQHREAQDQCLGAQGHQPRIDWFRFTASNTIHSLKLSTFLLLRRHNVIYNPLGDAQTRR